MLTFKQFLIEKELPASGTLMRRIWNMFDTYGAQIQGKNKIVYDKSDLESFIILVKEYLTKTLKLVLYKGDEFEDPHSHERFVLNISKNKVELVFN